VTFLSVKWKVGLYQTHGQLQKGCSVRSSHLSWQKQKTTLGGRSNVQTRMAAGPAVPLDAATCSAIVPSSRQHGQCSSRALAGLEKSKKSHSGCAYLRFFKLDQQTQKSPSTKRGSFAATQRTMQRAARSTPFTRPNQLPSSSGLLSGGRIWPLCDWQVNWNRCN
jgi:hypothetical protein